MRTSIKKGMSIICSVAMIMSMATGCGAKKDTTDGMTMGTSAESIHEETTTGEKQVINWFENATVIELSDEGIMVDGSEITSDEAAAVYLANDIVFYLEGQDFTYGEGEKADEHSCEEADAHTVVHITQPGTYAVSGSLSAGQIAVDLGEEAKNDSEAVVNLILNGVDINCTVAPGIIFYNVYECGNVDVASNTVDTSTAGANIIIADDTVNNVNGSYVARIYESVVLDETGTEIVESKKLHKYDAAVYSKVSMNVYGEAKNSGVLNINAENEGLDSELHLTINGGNINITAGNDGINTNEDGISVTTINGGVLTIHVTGTTGEGDGIDSNGWLVINGGTVIADACGLSGDAGIDSDKGIHINGGTVIATGNMLDRISESEQNYAVFSFASSQKSGNTYILKNSNSEVVYEITPENNFMYLIVSSDELMAGTYTLWAGDSQYAAMSGNAGGMGMAGGMPGGMGEMPKDGEMPNGMGEMPEGMELPEGFEMPEGFEIPEGGMPQGGERPDGMGELPEGEMPQGGNHPNGGQGMMITGEVSTEFTINDGGNYFSNVSLAE